MKIIVPRSFYVRDTVEVARDLIGTLLVRTHQGNLLTGIITETEAYRYTDDPASHAFGGITKRNAPMFGCVGSAYVYFIYGNHFCVNIVARQEGLAAGAVLIRAIKPVQGIELMQIYRGNVPLKNLTNGPGKLTQAMGITMVENKIDMTEQGSLYVVEGECYPDSHVRATERIGIKQALDYQWRFVAT